MPENTRNSEILEAAATSADGTAIPYWARGRGRPLLLLHGALADHSVWDGVCAPLEDHALVVTVDRRSAFGDPFGRYAPEREFEDIAAVAAALGDEVDVVGWSSGGVCALGAAPQIKGLRRLVLYEPPWIGGPLRPPLMSQLEEALAADDVDTLLETFLGGMVGLPPDVVAALRASPMWASFRDRAPFIPREMAALYAWRIDPEPYCSLSLPTLFLAGANTPEGHHHRGYAEVLRGTLSDLHEAEIPGQDHMAPLLDPAAFAAAIWDFVTLG